MIPTQNTDHAGTALALLTDCFKGRPVIQGLIKSFAASVQTIENTVFDVLSLRLLANATNAQLDTLGKLVGEPRDGRNDTDYRAAIRLRIKVNRSQGRAEDVIQVAAIALAGASPSYQEFYPAGFEVKAFNVSGVKSVIRLLGQTRAAATRGVLIYSNFPVSNNFVFSSSTGTVSNAKAIKDYLGRDSVGLSEFVAANEVNP